MTLLILLLVLALLLYLCLSRWMRTERDSLGVGNHAVVSADDSATWRTYVAVEALWPGG